MCGTGLPSHRGAALPTGTAAWPEEPKAPQLTCFVNS